MDGTPLQHDDMPPYKHMKYNLFPSEPESSLSMDFDPFLIREILRKPTWLESSMMWKKADDREAMAVLRSWFEISLWKMLCYFITKGKEWGVTRNLLVFGLASIEMVNRELPLSPSLRACIVNHLLNFDGKFNIRTLVDAVLDLPQKPKMVSNMLDAWLETNPDLKWAPKHGTTGHDSLATMVFELGDYQQLARMEDGGPSAFLRALGTMIEEQTRPGLNRENFFISNLILDEMIMRNPTVLVCPFSYIQDRGPVGFLG